MRFLFLILWVAVLASLASAQTPMVTNVANAASYETQAQAPGSIVAIFGNNLAGSIAVSDTIPLSYKLSSVTSVTFNNVKAPLFFAATTKAPAAQINAQVPFEALPSGQMSATVNMVVNTTAGASAPVPVTIDQTLPGIFTVNQGGTAQAIVTDNADGSFAAPTNSIPGVVSHPFSISTQGQNGHALIIWCNGLGPVNPSVADGENSYTNGVLTLRHTDAQPPNLCPTGVTCPNLTVLVGNVPAQILFSGLAPQFVGLYQVDVLLGPGTPTGNAVPVQIQVNGFTTSNNVTLAITN